MQTSNLRRAGILAVVLSLIFIICWEIHLRNTGLPVSYDDNEALWANKRSRVYEPRDQTTVFIGSSRIKYDLDVPTWETLTGTHAIQLGNLGSSPRSVLTDLANDPGFSGRLIIDVTEPLFFSDFNPRDVETFSKIKYYHHLTPTQRASFQINHLLESRLMFLDQDNFSLNGMLDMSGFPRRAGIFRLPDFPIDFHCQTFARQSYMSPKFLVDTQQQNQVKAIWKFIGSRPGPPPASGEKLQGILASVKGEIDRIKSRGGEVLFTRTPSSGLMRQGELHGFPRSVYWESLLAATDCPGIYFEDDPVVAAMICPEWSHLSPSDAKIYTARLVKSIREKGWTFRNPVASN